ncbi:MAG: 6-bladed beta-propeller [Candidatus Auribacterota bacterium]
MKKHNLFFIGILLAASMFVLTSNCFADNSNFYTKWGSLGSGDGQFRTPEGIAIDNSGNIYVADFYNYRVQKFNPYGGFITKWGSEGTGDGQFKAPTGIAINSSGKVYVTEFYNHRIQVFDSNGTFITKWGSLGTGNGQLYYPEGIAIDSSGKVYVTEFYNDRIQVFDSNGTFITKWGSLGTGNGQFDNPADVAIDSSGKVYVADRSNHRIQVFDSNGMFITKWGSQGTGNGQFDNPGGVAVDSSGKVYVADRGNDRIQVFDSNGTFITKWGSLGTGNGQFDTPYEIAVNSDGKVYVTDRSNNRIQVFFGNDAGSNIIAKKGQTISFSGHILPNVVPVWGFGDNSDFIASTLTPTHAYSSAGVYTVTLYGLSTTIKDTLQVTVNNLLPVAVLPNQCVGLANEKVEIDTSASYDPDGRAITNSSWNYGDGTVSDSIYYLTQWGETGDSVNKFKEPASIAVDNESNVYVFDRGNMRMTKYNSVGNYSAMFKVNYEFTFHPFVEPGGVAVSNLGYVYCIWTHTDTVRKYDLNGNSLLVWGAPGSGTGEFSEASHICTDSAGNVYVSDTGNDRIQKFNANGGFIAAWGSTGSGNDQFMSPSAIASAPNDIIYVHDKGNSRIKRFNSNGNYLSTWAVGHYNNGVFSGDLGMTIDNDGYVYLITSNLLQVFTSDGDLIDEYDGSGQFDAPEDLAVYKDGTIFVADTNNDKIRKLKFMKKASTMDHYYSTAGTYTVQYRIKNDRNDWSQWASSTLHVLESTVDNDGDGITNDWEITNDTNPLQNDSGVDNDHDGVDNVSEYTNSTDPNDADSDDDGMSDKYEIMYNLNPLSDDSANDDDNDGLSHGDEALFGTNPHLADTDNDGKSDSEEIIAGSDPLDPASYFAVTTFKIFSEYLDAEVPIIAWSSAPDVVYTIWVKIADGNFVILYDNFVATDLESFCVDQGSDTIPNPLSDDRTRVYKVTVKE